MRGPCVRTQVSCYRFDHFGMWPRGGRCGGGGAAAVDGRDSVRSRGGAPPRQPDRGGVVVQRHRRAGSGCCLRPIQRGAAGYAVGAPADPCAGASRSRDRGPCRCQDQCGGFRGRETPPVTDRYLSDGPSRGHCARGSGPVAQPRGRWRAPSRWARVAAGWSLHPGIVGSQPATPAENRPILVAFPPSPVGSCIAERHVTRAVAPLRIRWRHDLLE